jgi:nucleoside-diphosphate-sugar epimerase
MQAIEDWRTLLAPCDAVVHCAALAHRLGSDQPNEDEYLSVNAGIVKRLAIAARDGRHRVVFLSSIGAVCSASDAPVAEDTPPHPTTAYGRSKLEGERLLAECLTDTASDWVIIRPPVVYGRGNPGNMERIERAIRSGAWLPSGPRAARRTLVAVDNLVDALAVAVSHPAAARRTFHVGDGEALQFQEIIRRIADAVGRSPRVVPTPRTALRVAAVAARLAALAGVSSADRLPETIDRIAASLVVDDSQFRRSTGWSPPLSGEEAFRRAFGAGARA